MVSFRVRRRASSRPRNWGQRGIALTSYAMVLSTFTATSLVVIDSLNTESEEFLVNTGSAIGEPREAREVLATIDLGTAPPWAPAPTTTTTTTAPSSSSSSSSSSSTSSSSTSSTLPPPTYTETYLGPTVADSSSLCLQAQAGGQLVQAGCSGGGNQSVSVQESSAGGSQLQIDGQCIAPVDTSNGAAIVVVPCVDHDSSQLWTQAGGTWVNSESGRCLDIPGNSMSAGTQLIQWNCHGNPNQTFSAPGLAASLTATAADAVLSGDMVLIGGAVGVPNNGENFNNGDGSGNTNNKATFTFTVTVAGTYQVKGYVNGDSGMDDSFWIQVDGSPADGTRWNTRSSGGYGWDDAPGTFDLEPGVHTVTLAMREDGTFVQELELVLVP